MRKVDGLKKVLSFFMVLTIVFSMLPVNAFAQNIVDGEEVQGQTYQEGDTIWLPDGEEPSQESYPLDTGRGDQWVKTPQTRQELTCGVENHGHTYLCSDPCEKIHAHVAACHGKTYTCGIEVHTHDAGCNGTVWNCGQEESAGHAHVVDCYHPVLTCEINNTGHQHEEICYATSETPTCGIAEVHEHDAVACYAEDGVTLTCTQVVHTHGDSCYGQVLTCVKEIGEGAHVHGEDCYTTDEIPDCGINEGDGAHFHAAAGCTSEEKLICGKDAHAHTEECNWEYNGELVCGLDDTHVCVTEGCALDCTEAHHTDSCCTTMRMWGVANYGIATTAETVMVRVYVKTVAGTNGVQNATVTATNSTGQKTEQKTSKNEGTWYNKSYYAELSLNAGEEYTLTASYTDSGYTYNSETVTIIPEEDQSVDVMLILPIRFFVAAPGQAAEPSGTYADYRRASWDGAIAKIGLPANLNSQNGLRNQDAEASVTQYVANWPTGFGADSWKTGWESISFRNGGTYKENEGYKVKWVTICVRNDEDSEYWRRCGCGANYDHVHIDGVLTKEVKLPDTVHLYKFIDEKDANLAADTTFRFKMERLVQDGNFNPTTTVDSSFAPINLVATIPAGQTEAELTPEEGGSIPTMTYGYYKVTEIPDARWENDKNQITNGGNGGAIYVRVATDGKVTYSSSYNSGYYTPESKVGFHNARLNIHTVTYQWVVYGLNGQDPSSSLPGGTYDVPNPATVRKGQTHDSKAYNGFTNQSTYYDYENGVKYTFSGWTNYSLENKYQDKPDGTDYIKMPDTGLVPVNGDTWINGYWTAEELEPADAYLLLDKVVKVGTWEGNTFTETTDTQAVADVLEQIQEQRLFFQVDTGYLVHGEDDTIVEVDYPTLKRDRAGYQINVYQYGEPFVFTEKQADIHGYDRKTIVTLSDEGELSFANASSVEGDTASVTINPKYEETVMAHNLGTVTYTNYYTKSISEAISSYPVLHFSKRGETEIDYLDGAEFKLYTDAECVTPAMKGENPITITTATADGVKGTAQIDFTGMAPGTYYLKETKAPEGYVLSDAVYAITLTKQEPVEELRKDEYDAYSYVNVTYYTLSVEIPDETKAHFYDNAAVAGQAVETTNGQYLLVVHNEQIKNDLTISKSFYCEKDQKNFIPATGSSILIDIYGPVEYANDRVTIASIGDVVYNDFVIDSDDQWVRTINDLPYGDYFVEEVQASIHGYIWNSTKYNGNAPVTHNGHTGTVISVAEHNRNIDLHIENRYTEWDAADLYIEKTDGAQSDIAGAVFKLTDASGNDVTDAHLGVGFISATTNINGQLHLTGFKADEGKTETFYLEEVQAATGYYLGQHKWVIKVSHVGTEYTIDVTHMDGSSCAGWGDNEILTVSNTPILGQITVSKAFVGDEIPENAPITVTVIGNGKNETKSLTRNNPTAVFENLPLGTYTVTENPTLAGHTHMSATVSVNGQTATDGTSATVTLSDTTSGKYTDTMVIPDSAKGTVAFTNTYKRNEDLIVHPASLTIIKTDENGKYLPGATFTLYNDEACKDPVDVRDADIPDNFTVSAASDRNGMVHFYNLKLDDLAYDQYTKDTKRSKTFYLQESQAPEGYVRDTRVWEVKLTEEFRKDGDSKVYIDVLNADRNMFETILDWIAGITGGNTNESINADLVVANVPIKGQMNFTKTYNFRDEKGENTVTTPSLTGTSVTIHAHGPVVWEDAATKKSVADMGTEYVLELEDGDTTGSIENLPLGDYLVHETFASVHGFNWVEGGTLTGTDKTVKMTHSNVEYIYHVYSVTENADDTSTPVEIGITNTYKQWDAADFYVHKVDENGKDLAGATFTLYTDAACTTPAVPAAGTFNAVATTGTDGLAHFNNFRVEKGQESTFFVKESDAPAGYHLNQSVWKVVIDHTTDQYDLTITNVTSGSAPADGVDGNTDTITVSDTRVLGTIKITKDFTNGIPNVKAEDSNTLEPLSEIRVNVYNGPNIVYDEIILNADNQWTQTLENVPMGTYAVQEQNADVPGYTLNATYSKEIKYGEETAAGANLLAAGAYAEVKLVEKVDPQTRRRIAPDATVTIENAYHKQVKVVTIPTSFTIQKLDGADRTTVLPGAKFRITDSKGAVVDANGAAEGTDLVTDANGRVIVANLELTEEQYDYYLGSQAGREVVYTLTEIDAPAGYKKSEAIWKIKLKENVVSIEEIDTKDNKFTATIKWLVDLFRNENESLLGSNNILTVYNDPIKGQLNFTKTHKFYKKTVEETTGETTLVELGENEKPSLTGTGITIHVHGPVEWEDENKQTVTSMGKEYVLELKDGALTGTIGNLPLGDYLVHETFASIHGFNWVEGGKISGTDKTVSMTHDNVTYTYSVFSVVENEAEGSTAVNVNIENSYTEWDAVDFYVHKVDNSGGDDPSKGKDLPGAEFTLYKVVGITEEFVEMKPTGDDGLAHFSGIAVEAGKTQIYKVRETKAPAGYYLNSEAVWTVTVSHDAVGYTMEIDGPAGTFNNTTDNITVVNQPILADLTIRKAFAGNAVPDDAIINVTVTGPNGYNETVILSKDTDTSDNVDTNWKAILKGLPLGTYTITEDTVLADIVGYDLISTGYSTTPGESAQDEATAAAHTGICVEFTDTKTAETVTITNTYKKNTGVVNNPDSFTILKTDDLGKPLPGAVFTLTNDHSPTQIRTFTTGADGKVVVDGLIGHGTVTNAYDTVYTLAETTAPAGHIKSNELWKITVEEVDDEPQIEVNRVEDRYDTIWDWIIGAFVKNTGWKAAEKILTVQNARQTVPVSVTKTVDIKGLANAEQDAWVQKNILNNEYEFELYIDDVKKESKTVEAGETVTFDNKVPYGSKYEVKEVVPADAFFTSTLTGNTGEFMTASMTAINVTAVNTCTFAVTNDLTLDLYKVASGSYQPLYGASFTLYDEKGAWVDAGTSGTNGSFTITIPAAGEYKLKETIAPTGYNKLNTAIKIDAEYTYTVAIMNGQPVICKVLTATVDGGRKVVSLGNNAYRIKNNMITGNPGTGDNIMIAVGVMVGAAALLVMMFFFARRKRKYHRD